MIVADQRYPLPGQERQGRCGARFPPSSAEPFHGIRSATNLELLARARCRHSSRLSSLSVLGDSDDRFDAPKKLNQEHHETLPFVPRGNHRKTQELMPFPRSPDRHPGRSASARAGFLNLVVCDSHPSIVSLHSCNTVFVSDLARRRHTTIHPNGRTPSTRTLGTGTGVTLEPGFPSFFPGSGAVLVG